jgi:hypothetical protein
MKSPKFMVMALISGLAIGAASPAFAFSPDRDASQVAAEKTLAKVTLDVDKADVVFSQFSQGRVPPSTQAQYKREYVTGRRAFENGQYDEAIAQGRPDYPEHARVGRP